MTRPTKARKAAFTSMPLRQRFFDRVWEVVRRIPPGRVTTYGRIASSLRRPPGITLPHFKASGPRWVGQAMAHCPPDVPWHRVINAQGKISRRARDDGDQLQRCLLEAEGVAFDAQGRIDFELFGWPSRQRRSP